MGRLTVVKIQTKEILITSREFWAETIRSLEEGGVRDRPAVLLAPFLLRHGSDALYRSLP